MDRTACIRVHFTFSFTFSMETTARRMRLSVSYSTLPMFSKHFFFLQSSDLFRFLAPKFSETVSEPRQGEYFIVIIYCLKSSRKFFYYYFQ